MSPPLDRSSPGLDGLVTAIRGYGPSLIAFSGGVDSGVVAAAAFQALGKSAVAVTVTGPSVSREEVDRASKVARVIGIEHRLVPVDHLSDPSYAANPVDRCYFCRRLEGSALVGLARAEGYTSVVDGLHRDDDQDDRPGRRAMDELGIRHPLWEVGFGKSEVRALASALGLPNQATPANSCLASRIPHGEVITRESLARIEQAEDYLHTLGFHQVRVRSSAGSARVEVGIEELPRLQDPRLQAEVQARLFGLGFMSVRTDPRGYRPGGGA